MVLSSTVPSFCSSPIVCRNCCLSVQERYGRTVGETFVHTWRRPGGIRALKSSRCMAPEDEKMTRRSPLDFPVEWDRPQPGRRPDIFPQFSPMKTPLPPPLPADPPEEEEDEEEKKEEEPEKEPDKPEE